jgi:hypothetical protein
MRVSSRGWRTFFNLGSEDFEFNHLKAIRLKVHFSKA